jgi:hypothetical protein
MLQPSKEANMAPAPQQSMCPLYVAAVAVGSALLMGLHTGDDEAMLRACTPEYWTTLSAEAVVLALSVASVSTISPVQSS